MHCCILVVTDKVTLSDLQSITVPETTDLCNAKVVVYIIFAISCLWSVYELVVIIFVPYLSGMSVIEQLTCLKVFSPVPYCFCLSPCTVLLIIL
jgi:hypothetical protein